MKKPNITPGKWKASGLTIKSCDGKAITSIKRHTRMESEREANAKAISAAPDMINALMHINEFHRHHIGSSARRQLIVALKKAGVEL